MRGCNEYLERKCSSESSTFSNQEEDSEEEPKLKYERLSNGVTEILQKDAASCMTVHDKVEVIIHHPQGHFSLKYRFPIFMYTCPLQSWFSSPLFNP